MPKFIKVVTKSDPTPAPTFWHYDQNNSGGYWVRDLPHDLFIEAATASQANAIAMSMGVDFSDSNDFSGERWRAHTRYDVGMVTLTLYGQELETYLATAKYVPFDYLAAVVYLNGETVHYRAVPKE